MARIAGVDLPKNKRLDIALTYIVGIGMTTSKRIIAEANLDPALRTTALTDEEAGRIRKIIDSSYSVEGDVRREVTSNIKRLMDMGVYRGLRHRKGLPCRGQRTRTNSRTRKGRMKRTVAGKKKAPRK